MDLDMDVDMSVMMTLRFSSMMTSQRSATRSEERVAEWASLKLEDLALQVWRSLYQDQLSVSNKHAEYKQPSNELELVSLGQTTTSLRQAWRSIRSP